MGPDEDGAWPHVQVPLALLADADISDGAKVLWALLRQYSLTGGGEVFEMSQDEMATLCGASAPSVRKRRDELAAAGWLEVTVLPGLARRQHLTVLVPGQETPVREDH